MDKGREDTDMSVYAIYFSPTKGTEKIVKLLSEDFRFLQGNGFKQAEGREKYCGF